MWYNYNVLTITFEPLLGDQPRGDPFGEMASVRLKRVRQKSPKGVAETSIYLNTNTLGGL